MAIWDDIRRIRQEAPLVHNITNYVVMNSTANVLLAAGASPVMSHAIEEVAEMTAISRALVLNIGTLSRPWIEAMLAASREAARRRIPVIFDPVGSGATRFRTETARRILDEARPAIVRGNGSEIASLSPRKGASAATKGVDSTSSSEEASGAARALAAERGCVVVVSGATDIIVGAGRTVLVRNGHPLMARVTGMGCAATALIGAFAAVESSAVDAAAYGMALSGIAGEIAASRAAGPGSMQVHFLDALASVTHDDVSGRLRMEEQGDMPS